MCVKHVVPAGGAVWGGYKTSEDGVLLEKVYHWGVGLEGLQPCITSCSCSFPLSVSYVYKMRLTSFPLCAFRTMMVYPYEALS